LLSRRGADGKRRAVKARLVRRVAAGNTISGAWRARAGQALEETAFCNYRRRCGTLKGGGRGLSGLGQEAALRLPTHASTASGLPILLVWVEHRVADSRTDPHPREFVEVIAHRAGFQQVA